MTWTLVEHNEKGKTAYDSKILDSPGSFSVLSPIAIKIIKVLAEKPTSAIDISRKLKINWQKAYYYMRKLEKAGLIASLYTERRHGMVAKIYSVVSPVISAKLYETGGTEVKDTGRSMPLEINEFLSPFIKDGSLNAKIIVGDTERHGKYEARAIDSPFLINFMLFLGSMLNNFDTSRVIYKFDTEVTDNDLKNNLILIGNPKINSITDRINDSLPIYFDVNNDFRIVSRLTGSKYQYNLDAVILKTKNPFYKDKEMLLLAGKRSSGLQSAVLAVMTESKEILNGNIKNKDMIAKVVTGIDSDSDGIVDQVKFHE